MQTILKNIESKTSEFDQSFKILTAQNVNDSGDETPDEILSDPRRCIRMGYMNYEDSSTDDEILSDPSRCIRMGRIEYDNIINDNDDDLFLNSKKSTNTEPVINRRTQIISEEENKCREHNDDNLFLNPKKCINIESNDDDDLFLNSKKCINTKPVINRIKQIMSEEEKENKCREHMEYVKKCVLQREIELGRKLEKDDWIDIMTKIMFEHYHHYVKLAENDFSHLKGTRNMNQ